MKTHYSAALIALSLCLISPTYGATAPSDGGSDAAASADTSSTQSTLTAAPTSSDSGSTQSTGATPTSWLDSDFSQPSTSATSTAPSDSGDRGIPSSKVTYPQWHQLKNPQALSPLDRNPAFHYRFKAGNGSTVDLVVTDLNSPTWQLKPGLVDSVAVTAEKANQDGATVIVNGGYFNMADRESVSYVVVDGKMVLDPGSSGAVLKIVRPGEFPETILNRSEMRVLVNGGGKNIFDVAQHNTGIPTGLKLQHSLQAGPNLLTPDGQFDEAALTREGFIKEEHGKKVDSINTMGPDARTAVGVTGDGFVLIACVADRKHDPESIGLSLKELAEMMHDLGCVKAVNLDGGGSTSMFVRHRTAKGEPNRLEPGETTCANHPERPVKSFLELKHSSVAVTSDTTEKR